MYFSFAMSRNYKFHNKSGLYFVSFATVNWMDVFTRQLYFDILAESVSYCRNDKGKGFCFYYKVMLNFKSIMEQAVGFG